MPLSTVLPDVSRNVPGAQNVLHTTNFLQVISALNKATEINSKYLPENLLSCDCFKY